MSLSCGIVGLPNVGKSTLFNALCQAQAPAENYPFCTIEPNKATVIVPDERIKQLSQVSKSENTIYSTIEMVDIAGLIKGASKGEGLGNKFISHILEVDLIVEVVRLFSDETILRDGDIDPEKDIDTIHSELIFYDLERIEKQIEKLEKETRHAKDSEAKKIIPTLKKAKEVLLDSRLLYSTLSREEKESIRSFNLITAKPFLIAVNVDENALTSIESYDPFQKLKELAEKLSIEVIPLSAIAEVELRGLEISLDPASMREYLEVFKLKQTGCSTLIEKCFKKLNLISFLTSGEKETRAWTISAGTTAVEAAGKIHSDIERGFICLEVVDYQDFCELKSWKACKGAGKIRREGKQYAIKDGDVCFFKFNV